MTHIDNNKPTYAGVLFRAQVQYDIFVDRITTAFRNILGLKYFCALIKIT